jgi:hypothetical protein
MSEASRSIFHFFLGPNHITLSLKLKEHSRTLLWASACQKYDDPSMWTVDTHTRSRFANNFNGRAQIHARIRKV